jgi:hypothetical protein
LRAPPAPRGRRDRLPKLRIGKQDGIIGHGLPAFPPCSTAAPHDGSTLGRLAADAEMDAVFAVPFIHAGQSKAAIAWCF